MYTRSISTITGILIHAPFLYVMLAAFAFRLRPPHCAERATALTLQTVDCQPAHRDRHRKRLATCGPAAAPSTSPGLLQKARRRGTPQEFNLRFEADDHECRRKLTEMLICMDGGGPAYAQAPNHLRPQPARNKSRGLRHFGYCKTTLTVPYRKYEPFYDPSRLLP